jgi:hypothetical protein
MRITTQSSGPLLITDIPAAAATVAIRGARAEEPVLPPEFQSDKVSVEKAYSIALTPESLQERRAGELPMIAINAETAEDEAPLLVLRHPSGAITFHPGTVAAGRRGAAAAKTVYEFRIPLRRGNTASGRRGLAAEVVKAAVLKVARPVVDKAVSFVLPKLVRLWEEQTWKKKGLEEGWFRVVAPADGGAFRLEPGVPEPGKRTLLFIHGTFSNAESGFVSLTKTDFFKRVAPLYEGRIFAFNHFTVSKSPQENAEMLLAALPGRCNFDVITHSRGGLVLRTIVERGADFGDRGQRFQVGRAVLVASPNDGTPLATPDRWDHTVGWVANLIKITERFTPENPFLTGAEFVSEALVWLAHHLAGDLPGLRSMDRAGETIEELQGPPAPPANAYSALVANFSPDENILQIMLDTGVDQFFNSANDLVVPSEGGWRIDRDGMQHMAAGAVGCFGPGGNLAPGEPSAVLHTNFFRRQETATFLARALSGEDQGLAKINLDAPLPDRRFLRAATATAAAAPSAPSRAAGPRLPEAAGAGVTIPTTAARDTFHIVIIEVPQLETAGADGPKAAGPPERRALIYAAYGGARVVEEFPLRGGAAGENWRRIIAIHEQIKNATDRGKGDMPSDRDMGLLGRLLFTTLFPGDVKRLYDTARSLQGSRRLDLVFTSMVHWVAEKPWEFAFDPGRKTFLATEEIHFVRNVLTQVPGDASDPRPGPLRILVVSAQPPGTIELSIDQETDMIKRDFAALTDAGLAAVEVLPRATISDLHAKLATGEFNVVHFIGHGAFDDNTRQGFLLFEGQPGAPSRLDQRSARELLCGRGVKLLFLNACQTGASSPSPADFNSGLAQDLVAHGLPALVANQYSVLDSAATSFAQFFYWGLARGLSFGAAAREARISVNYALAGQAVIDWAVPVLYARDPNSTLTTSTAPVPFVKPMSPSETQPRRSPEQLKIAVWDVDRAMPRLQEILGRMNAAQARFQFDVANLSAPLDAFKMVDGERYLWKERVAKRLHGCAGELGANLLLCLTRYSLNPDGGRAIHTWWPEAGESPVLIFSYAGVALDPDSLDAARALANSIVRALAATQQQLVFHKTGPADCPMFASPQGDTAGLTGRQELDKDCRARIKDEAFAAALDALLRVFDAPGEASRTARAEAGTKSTRRRTTRRTTRRAKVA